MIATSTATWSLVRGASPTAHAVEPGPHGIAIPGEILDWAEQHGLDTGDPDVYLLVAPTCEAGEVAGEIAHRTHSIEDGDLAILKAALDA